MPWWTIAFWTLLLATASYAFVRGGAHERWAAGMLVGAAMVTTLVRSPGPLRFSTVDVGVVLVDAALLVGLCAVAVRSGRRWALLLATLQSLTLVGHLGKWLEPDLWRLGYAIMITGPAWPGLMLVVAGTWLHGRRTAPTRS